MIIDVRKNLAFLAITKCASTTVEGVLNQVAPRAINIRGNPALKHTTYRQVEKFIIPFLKSKNIERPHFFAVIREPAERLLSWYLYRTRDELAKAPENSPKGKRYTGNISINEFVMMNIEPCDEETSERQASITDTQFSFLQDSGGKIGVDTIIPIQHLNDYLPIFLNEFGYNFPRRKLNMKRNQSPTSNQISINDDLRNAINTSDRFRQDYEIFIEASKNYKKEHWQ